MKSFTFGELPDDTNSPNKTLTKIVDPMFIPLQSNGEFFPIRYKTTNVIANMTPAMMVVFVENSDIVDRYSGEDAIRNRLNMIIRSYHTSDDCYKSLQFYVFGMYGQSFFESYHWLPGKASGTYGIIGLCPDILYVDTKDTAIGFI